MLPAIVADRPKAVKDYSMGTVVKGGSAGNLWQYLTMNMPIFLFSLLARLRHEEGIKGSGILPTP